MTQTDSEMEIPLGITVVTEKMETTYTQTIQLRERNKIAEAFIHLLTRLAREGMTGQITAEMQQGGCRRVIVRHVGNVPIGSVLQRQIEAAFDKKNGPA